MPLGLNSYFARPRRLPFWLALAGVLTETVAFWTVMAWVGNQMLWLLKALSTPGPQDTVWWLLVAVTAVLLVVALVFVVILFIGWLVLSAWLMGCIKNNQG